MSKHPDLSSDETLAKMARAGDRRAFEILCDRYLPAVYNRLRAMLPPDAVEDVTQEVFLAAMKGVRRYRGKSSFRTWIAGITRHKVADYYRARSRQPETAPLDDETNDPATRTTWEEKVLVRIALQCLPAHYQEVLLLRFAEGLPFAQVASALDISLEATKSRYRRAVAALAEEMDQG
jgi:RNA polymerase sigma-70 factor (ECF subfamily)